LQLVKDDVPVHGRVRDLEGRPVVGAAVRVDHLRFGQGDLWQHLWQTSWAGLPENMTTDREGRFTLTGIGRDRQAVLHIAGPTMEHKIVAVSTQATADGKKVERAQIEVIAGPTKPIEGTVRAGDTGQPLAGVVVYGSEEAYLRGIRAVTDGQGRYRLV